MAQIVRLAEYQKGRHAPKLREAAQARRLDSAPHYYCLRCDTDQFRLYPSGSVHCSHCGALMRNISVADTDKGASG